jgi:hypothetical protein
LGNYVKKQKAREMREDMEPGFEAARHLGRRMALPELLSTVVSGRGLAHHGCPVMSDPAWKSVLCKRGDRTWIDRNDGEDSVEEDASRLAPRLRIMARL